MENGLDESGTSLYICKSMMVYDMTVTMKIANSPRIPKNSSRNTKKVKLMIIPISVQSVKKDFTTGLGSNGTVILINSLYRIHV